MSILSNILSGIFGRAQASQPAGKPPVGGMQDSGSFQAAPAGRQQSQPVAQQSYRSPANIPFAPPGGAAQQRVDVEALLDGMAAQEKQKLDWRHSIVDLMKLLDLDSGLAARKELASELHFTGDMNDSAAMNIWLHKQVMKKLEENGGKVPDSLKH
jgi:hypothetical protein